MTPVRLGDLFAAACAVLLLTGAAARAQDPALPTLADAPPGAVRLFVAGSLRAPVLSIGPLLEKATGRKVVMEVTESRTLQRKIEAGQPFEAALLTTAVLDDLTAKGRIVPGSALQVAMVRVGVGVRGDAPKLDVTTPEGLKKAILGARSIRRFYGVAASTPIIDNLFAKLDLTAATKDRMVELSNEKVVPEEPLPPGQYELLINLISAVAPLKTWTYVGAIPEQFQMPVPHAAGLGATGDRAMGQKVLDVLKSPQFDAALAASKISRN